MSSFMASSTLSLFAQCTKQQHSQCPEINLEISLEVPNAEDVLFCWMRFHCTSFNTPIVEASF